jgi:hypothetical protein
MLSFYQFTADRNLLSGHALYLIQNNLLLFENNDSNYPATC